MRKNDYVAEVTFIEGFNHKNYYFALSKENYEAIVGTGAKYALVNNKSNFSARHLVEILKLYTTEDSPWKNPEAEVVGVFVDFNNPSFKTKKVRKKLDDLLYK